MRQVIAERLSVSGKGSYRSLSLLLPITLLFVSCLSAEEYCVQIWAQTQEQLADYSSRAARYKKPLNFSVEEGWVRVGKSLSHEEAQALSERLHQEEGLETWVVKQSPDGGYNSRAQEEIGSRYSSQGAFAQGELTRERLAALLGDAISLFGTPYKFGGESIEEGLDCSSFVQLIFEAVGMDIPRNARSQYKIGEKIAKTDLQTGDLVFFKNTYRRGISHVGVYLGAGEFIHASAGRSREVTLSNLSEPYYMRKYAGARRLF